jgi:hypothetical protein
MTGETWSGAKESQSYTTVAILLHWVIAAAILVQILGGWAMEDLKGPEKFCSPCFACSGDWPIPHPHCPRA